MSLGNRIREARERAKLNQEQMAELVNVGRTTISVWENDKKTPGGKNLDRLAAVLGVSTDFLMGRDLLF